ncbi:hypothetical protein [Methanopyrus sp.]
MFILVTSNFLSFNRYTVTEEELYETGYNLVTKLLKDPPRHYHTVKIRVNGKKGKVLTHAGEPVLFVFAGYPGVSEDAKVFVEMNGKEEAIRPGSTVDLDWRDPSEVLSNVTGFFAGSRYHYEQSIVLAGASLTLSTVLPEDLIERLKELGPPKKLPGSSTGGGGEVKIRRMTSEGILGSIRRLLSKFRR